MNGFSVPMSGAGQGPQEWSRHPGLGEQPRLGAPIVGTPRSYCVCRCGRGISTFLQCFLERWDPGKMGSHCL